MARLSEHLFSELDSLKDPDKRQVIHSNLIKLVALGMRAEIVAIKADKPSTSMSALRGAALGGAAIQQALAARGMNSRKAITTTARRVNGQATGLAEEEMY